jgi:type II secretory pathway pseudopilin PulG
VELLIVIVVIGILAAIVIVAYNGIQQSARSAVAKSSASQAAAALSTYSVQNSDTYPTTLAIAGIVDSGGTTYQYSVNNSTSPASYCVTATVDSTSFYVSSTNNVPTTGACTGQSNGGQAAITNLALNPSFTVKTSPWLTNAGTGGTVSGSRPQTGGIVDGGPFTRITWSVLPTSSNGYITEGSGSVLATTAVTPGVTYTISGYVKTSWAAQVYVNTTSYTSGLGTVAGFAGPTVTLASGSWTRLSLTFTAPATAAVTTLRFSLVTGGPLPPSVGSTFDVDEVMATQGSTLYNYADGDSPSWSWTGTPSASTSTGYAL